MKNFLLRFRPGLPLLLCFLITAVPLWGQNFDWVRSEGSFQLDHGNGVVVDGSGNAYLTGALNGRPILRKYSSSGTLLWSRFLNNGQSGIGQALAMDANQAIYVTAEVNNQLTVLKYSSGGSLIWSRSPASGSGFYSGYGIAVAANGASVATGTSNGKIFIVKYSSSGSMLWSKSLGQTGNYCEGRAVALADNGEITVAGNFSGSFSFGSGMSVSSSSVDIFVFRMDANGNPRWLNTYGSNSSLESAYGLTAGPCGHLYVTGNLGGSLSFGQAGNHSSNGNDDIFLLKLQENGTELWAKSFGSGNGFEAGFGVTTDPLGNVLLVGAFSGTTIFGSGQVHSPQGNQDIFVAKYNPQGTLLWMTTQGGSQLDEAKSVAVDPTGAIYIAGRYSGTSTFYPGVVLVSSCTDYYIQRFRDNYDFFSSIGQGNCKDNPATLSVSGGQFWQWSTGATTSSIQVNQSGTYSVSITDAQGCVLASHSANITISVKPQFTLSGSGIDCQNPNNGQINLQLQYGAPPLSYQWSNGATSQNLSGLGPGTYSVTVTDANGCQNIKSISLQGPPPIGLGLQPQNPTCAGNNDGSVHSTITGGTPPFTYLWSNGSTSAHLSGVGAGTYGLTVSDQNACTQSASVTLSAPSSPVLSLSSPTFPCGTQVSCHGATDGRIGVQISGGTPPYQYAWSNGFSGTVQNGLPAGNYGVTVTDANGCTDVQSINLTAPSALLITTQVSQYGCNSGVSCQNGDDGWAWVRARGGCPPYSYQWSSGHTGMRAGNLSAGTYTVIVTDANGCSTGQTVILSEPSPLQISTSVQQQPCGYQVSCPDASDGSASLSLSGGCPPYSILWSNGASTDSVHNLGAGWSSVSVTDANGCQQMDSVYLQAPDPIQLDLDLSPATCQSPNQISLSVSGGAVCRRLQVQWTGPNGYSSSSQHLSNLVPGLYRVSVHDGNGCIAEDSVRIYSYDSLSLTIGAQTGPCGYHVSCAGGSTSQTAFVQVFGGSPPYSFLWTGPNGFSSTQPMLDSIPAGMYHLTVTDSSGCWVSDSLLINEPSPLQVNLTPTDATCNAPGSVSALVSGGANCQGYTYQWSTGASSSQLTGASPGTYSLTVSDANGCTAVASATVGGGTGTVSAWIDCCADTVLNCGDSTQIPIHFSGNGPWTFLVNDGQNSQSISTASNPYLLTVAPEQTASWTLQSVSEQGNTCPGEVCGRATIGVNGECSDCISIDFSRDSLGNPLPAGTILGEQWAHLGVHLSFWNAGGPPHEGIIFDSQNPTGGDWDLGTPHQDFGGPGIGAGGALGAPGQNDTPLGNVIIIADNVIDLNNDGLVDNPNDDAAGGYMRFDFDHPMKIISLKLLDMDVGANHSLVFTFADNSTQTLSVPNLGDNSVQDWTVNANNVVRMQFNLTTSGALAAVAACMECPEPTQAVTFHDLNNGGPCEDYRLDISCGSNTSTDTTDYLDISLPCGQISSYSNSLGLPMSLISGDTLGSGISGLRIYNLPPCGNNFSVNYSLCPDSSSCSPTGCPPLLAIGQGECLHYQTAVLPGASKLLQSYDQASVGFAVRAWPNPSTGNFQVEWSASQTQTASQIRVSNLQGQVVHSRSLDPGQHTTQIDLSDLTDGIYLLQVRSGQHHKVIRVVKAN